MDFSLNRVEGLKMEIKLSSRDQEFRFEVQTFLEDNLTPELREGADKRTSLWQDVETSMAWQRILHKKGWAAPEWPVEYGGTSWSLVQRYVFAQESARSGAPALLPMSLRMCGPMLIGYGTAEQKAYYLPRILSGEDFWCQGYSEPGAGSDLASLSTFAASDGEDYVVNGTKIWTSCAQHADMMFALVRTRKGGKKQEGITFLMIAMTLPGITVRPIINIAGVHELNQVFFEEVRVPKANRVGKENDGWTVAKYLLEFERFAMASVEIRRTLDRVETLAGVTPIAGGVLNGDPNFRSKLAKLKIETSVLEASERRVLAKLSAGDSPGTVSSLVRVQGAELLQRADMLGVEALGYYSAPFQPEVLEIGVNQPPVGPREGVTFVPMYLSNRMKTIAGGSSEVQRNIVAKAILGL